MCVWGGEEGGGGVGGGGGGGGGCAIPVHGELSNQGDVCVV